MSLIQERLDKSLPFGRVFQGSGEQDQHDRECRYYQHGLYFGADGKVLINNENNKGKVAQLRALEPNAADPDKPAAEILTVQREPVNPLIVQAFEAKSDEEVLAAAMRVIEFNTANGADPDTYEPTLDKRTDNIRFIAKYAG